MKAKISISQLAGPAIVLVVLAMLVVPLPGVVISFLFALNIAIGLVVLSASLYVESPSEFSSFPSVLLSTTLMRLALNVATSRTILLDGYSGPGAAGKVIEAFGYFMVGGNYVVGGIVFIILIIINFVVITKGASRVAEVSARFMLDSLPGRQMAIDAEVNAGVLNGEAAERRRSELRKEADFFGAMDGASKFVRGDVVAAMSILAINMVGGLLVGVFQYGLDLGEAARTFTLLTVGDGLAAQIPSLAISIAAGLVVTRVSTGEDIHAQIAGQISKYPQALGVSALITGILGVVPHMAHVPFFLFSGLLAGAAWKINEEQISVPNGPQENIEKGDGRNDAKIDAIPDVTGVDPLGMSIGFGLTSLVSGDEAKLLKRLTAVRQRYGRLMGFLVPAVHIRDSSDIQIHGYRFSIRGAYVSDGEAWPNQWLALSGHGVSAKLNKGHHVKDPAFGAPAVWIAQADIPLAEEMGYTVVDASSAIATHFSEILKKYGAELLGRPQVEALILRLAEGTPRLAEDLRASLSVSVIRQVLQALLIEGIPIRDFERISEALVECSENGAKDIDTLLSAVRSRLGRYIVNKFVAKDGVLRVIILGDKLEDLVYRSIKAAKDVGENLDIPPDIVGHLRESVVALMKEIKEVGGGVPLVVPSLMRRKISKALGDILTVLGIDEVPDSIRMKVIHTLGLNDERA
ncbi:FHIPEP family type III secretion protein [Acidocella sp.]|uniref:FHIPEP family type III secretion protein n=1 Tax=Acidocella sp. TaxID=50710 RepID=UPI002631B3D1|nr:FHIPEP family type III secretion protein [Acidocella sp.]